jgi:hypothetical protein
MDVTMPDLAHPPAYRGTMGMGLRSVPNHPCAHPTLELTSYIIAFRAELQKPRPT